MGYVLLRSMKVQKEDGTVELRQPGAEVPEAEKWANPDVWVRRGYIRPTDSLAAKPYDRSKLKPMRVATPADAKRGANAQSTAEAAGALTGQEVDEDPVENETDVDPVDELMGLSRPDLNELAKEHGVANPEKLKDKTAVAKAIVGAQVAS